LGFGTSLPGIPSARWFTVQTGTAKQPTGPKAVDPDIFFHCQHCQASLVVNRSAEGMTLTCQRCGKLTAVPKQTEPTADAVEQLQQIQRQLTENESQRTEVTGYINQLSIQLHRWQLRLQTLNERKQQLEKELSSLKR
jgi:DNA-directed RNA polymerase subunit M/transcription elongation factor TFIIS